MTGEGRNKVLFVADLIRQAFGINSPIYIPWGANKDYVPGSYNDVRLLPEGDDEALLSEFGTPVLGAVTFEAGEYNRYNKVTGAVEKVTMEAYTLPYSCIVQFTRSSNVTKTEVIGSTGTVKEIFGKGDWRVSIRGVAIGSRDGSGTTAHEQIEALVSWDNVADSIPVLGDVFGRKGISNIVFKSFEVLPVIGRYDAIPFRIEAVSDEPIELYLA